MKKIFALVLAMLLVLGMTSALAATITINRDSSWGTAEAVDKNATYTWYRIFDADLTDSAHPVYTISGDDAAEKVAALPALFKADLGADGKYYISLKNSSTSAADIVAAFKTMLTDASTAALFAHGSVTSAANPVVLDVEDNGYYYIEASNGKDIVLDTIGNVTITEKNDYPKLDKKQKREVDTTYIDAVINAEIGKVVDYEIIVTIPADANKALSVIDTMSAGLTYNNNFKAVVDGTDVTSSAAAMTGTEEDVKLGYLATAPAGYTIPFQVKFSADFVKANQGKQIVITYTATTNMDALIVDQKNNKARVVYDEGNYSLVDRVDYQYYYGGIEKVDGNNNTIKLEGVKFELTVGSNAYNVTPVLKGGDGEDANEILYYVPGGTSNEVITGKNGLIIIRGLDNAYTYTLTETETNKGYNLLNGSVNLTLKPDDGNYASQQNYDKVENFQGTELPETGGIGTTLFYIGGGILVLAAVILLVTKRRMNANND